MAEYDKRRLYWIKLTDRFISSDTVDFLMSQKDGANYIVLYQMLCLKTVNNGGILARELGEILVPYDIDKIQRDCKWFTTDTVRVALELFKKLGLVYQNQDGVLAITDFDKMIGSQTYSAEKKALQREAHKAELIGGGQKVDNCPPDKDIYKEKEKYIYSLLTTTTTEPPTLAEIYTYFKQLGCIDARKEAEKFSAYNETKEWACLPNWQASANLWIARME